jgi:hypothetical protein
MNTSSLFPMTMTNCDTYRVLIGYLSGTCHYQDMYVPSFQTGFLMINREINHSSPASTISTTRSVRRSMP